MSSKVTTKQDTKTALLQAGMDLMMEKGYTNTGINDVLTALGVPKGSFYHHFDSKESFAVGIIHYFDAAVFEDMTRVLTDSRQSPLKRLRTFCEAYKERLQSQKCRCGCLIGNLSQEMSDQSEVLRQELCKVMKRRRDLVVQCIQEGQNLKEITGKWAAEDLAQLFLAGWSGVIMQAKTVKNTQPLALFIDVMFNDFLKA